MLETLLWWFLAIVIFVIVGGIVIYLVAQWLFIRTAERMAAIVDRRVGGMAAHAFTGLARYAKATGIPIDEANRFFGLHIDRLARLMDIISPRPSRYRCAT